MLYRGGKFLLGMIMVLVMIFGTGRAGAEILNYDADAPFRAIEPHLSVTTQKLLLDGLLKSVVIRGSAGIAEMKVTSDGTYTVYTAGNEDSSYVWDITTGEMVKISQIYYEGGIKKFGYASHIDEATGTVEIGNMITVYDAFGNIDAVLRIDLNLPDPQRIGELIDGLFGELAKLQSQMPQFPLSIEIDEGLCYISLRGTDKRIGVSEDTVRSRAIGLLSIGYLAELAFGNPELSDGEHAFEDNAAVKKELSGLIINMLPGGEPEDKQKILTDAGAVINSSDDLEDELAEWLTESNLVMIIDGLIDHVDVEIDREYAQNKLAGALMDILTDEDDGVYEIATEDLILNLVTDPDLPGGWSETGEQELIKVLIRDAKVDSDDDLDGDQENGDSDGDRGDSIWEHIDYLLDDSASGYGPYVGALDRLGAGMHREGMPTLNEQQIAGLIEATIGSGVPCVYVNEDGTLFDDSLAEALGDDPLLATTKKDAAYAKVTISNVAFSGLDIMRGEEYMMEKLKSYFGEYDGPIDQEFLENNPLALAIMYITVIDGKEYVVTDLPFGGIAELSKYDPDYMTPLYEEGEGGDRVLNPDLTAKDFWDSALVYVKVLRDAALEQSLSPGAAEAVTFTFGLTNAYSHSGLNKLGAITGYDDETIENIIQLIGEGDSYFGDYAVDGDGEYIRDESGAIASETRNILYNLSLEEKCRVVNFLNAAVVAARDKKESFKFEDETYTFGEEDSAVFGTGEEGETIEIMIDGDINGDGNVNIKVRKIGDKKWADRHTRHIPIKNWVSPPQSYDRQPQYYLSIEQKVQSLVAAFHILKATVNGAVTAIEIEGGKAADPTSLFPKDGTPLFFSMEQLRKDEWMWGDPAVSGLVTNVYDRNMNLIEDFDIETYEGDVVHIEMEVGYWTDAAGIVHMHRAVWNSIDSEAKALVETNAKGMDFYGGGIVVEEDLAGITADSGALYQDLVTSGYINEKGVIQSEFTTLEGSFQLDLAGDYSQEEEEAIYVKLGQLKDAPSTMKITIEMDINILKQDLESLEGSAREEATANVNATLNGDAPLTCYGLINDSLNKILALGLGVGPFPEHPMWEDIYK